MNVLASTNTVWRIFISTRDIKRREKEENVAYSEIIAKGLSEILELDYEKLYEKIKKTNVLDVTVKQSVKSDKYNEVLDFTKKNQLYGLVLFEAQSSRFYPEGTLLAHTLGFCGSDNQGLYGLEYYYDKTLKGTDGYYLYARDANGNALYTEYTDYVEAVDGNSIITTIDTFVQIKLEEQLDKILREQGVNNRVCGIVMDSDTGAILAMATSSPFDPNNPYVLDEISKQTLSSSNLEKDSEEYKSLKNTLLQKMWSNKAISETYEPGSTFKIVTVSAALDSNSVSVSDRFSCNGYHTVGGWRIKCHKTTGHGSNFTLAYGLQMSCNPTMMKIAEKMGSDTFYSYVESFGYLEKTGIDLPGEASTIFHEKENIGSTELATLSFGQRFKVSIINQLTAVNTVANGGKLVTPYLVERIIDKDGNVVSEHTPEVRRTVISKKTADLVSEILEAGVSGDGGAKNARVEGYKVAAKTGTSQKFDVLDENGNSYLRIGSTVAYAPSDTGGISAIIVVDEPSGAVKYGSVVAAPYVSELLTSILPYLGYEKSGEQLSVKTENYVGMNVNDAKKSLSELGLDYEIVGNNDTVISQTPSPNDVINSKNTKIFLYTEEAKCEVEMPSLVGKSLIEASEILINLGLNIKIFGAGGGTVTKQSHPAGALLKKGRIVELYTLISDYED
jgi:stage V sporulation protein D (sporulation-specific penicillin-binding protein)